MALKTLIRADAGKTQGTGHIMRCFALGQQILANGGSVTYITKDIPKALEERLNNEGMHIHHLKTAAYGDDDLHETLHIAETVDWVILDGYNFTQHYQEELCKKAEHVLLMDDYGQYKHYLATIVLNQNVYATSTPYTSASVTTQVLLGAHYALLREEYAKQVVRNINEHAKHILVTLGGSDPDNVTATVVRALARIDDTEATVIIGSANVHREELECMQQNNIRIIANSTNMKELMLGADIAIAGGGTTVYELMNTGLPTLSICIADNQKPVVEALKKKNAILDLGWHSDISEEVLLHAITDLKNNAALRKKLSKNAQTLVDGKGAARIYKKMCAHMITIRPAKHDDMDMLFTWANDPVVRASSFNTDPIALKDHKEWFTNKLANTESHIFIGEDVSGTPIGQVRIDGKGHSSHIGINLAPEARGKGYGTPLILLAAEKVFAETDITEIHALIKTENNASVRAFEEAGFTYVGEETEQRHAAHHYMLSATYDIQY